MSKSPRVYAVQVPARRDGPRGGWVEKFDLSPAKEFGEVVRLLPYGNVPNEPERVHAQLKEALRDFDLDRDYLLLLGDPVAMAQAVSIVSRWGTFNTLKWDRRTGTYSPYRVG
jgi:hypothetical protein